MTNFLARIRSMWGSFFSYMIPTWVEGVPLPSKYDLTAFIRDAYEGNGLCFAATLEIATSMSEAKLCARRRGETKNIPDFNPLARLLRQPNDFQSMPELLIQTVCEMLACGNSYWLMDDAVLPSYVQNLPPDKVQVEYSGGKLWYVLNQMGKPAVTFPSARVLHFRESPDLSSPIPMGMSPIVPIRRFIMIDNILSRYVQDFFNNNAIPPALLIFKNKMTPPEIKLIEEKMRQEHSTAGNYHKIGISFGDAKLEKLGINVKDLDLKPVLDFVETRILQAFNIPPVLIGAQAAMGVSASYSNYREARASFQTENLAPRQQLMSEILTRGLASHFGEAYEIYFDQSNVLALQDVRDKQMKFALDAWNGGAFTLNQFYAACGLPEIDEPEGSLRKLQTVGGSGIFDPNKDTVTGAPQDAAATGGQNPPPKNGKDTAGKSEAIQ